MAVEKVSRDYKHRAQKRPQKKPLPGWLWLFVGLILGGFVAGLFWLHGQYEPAGGDWVGAQPDRPPQGKPAPRKPVEAPPPPKPRFDFYNMLPEMEVVVPDEELAQLPSKTEQAAAADYLLQIGSFRKTEDADRLKAQLALLGVESRVVAAQINPQDMRYRVRSGPYRGLAAVKQVRERLSANGHDGIVIRVER